MNVFDFGILCIFNIPIQLDYIVQNEINRFVQNKDFKIRAMCMLMLIVDGFDARLKDQEQWNHIWQRRPFEPIS